MTTKKKTATEASAAAAVAVAVAFAFNGAFILAAVAGIIGVGLFALYEYFGVTDVQLSEEELEKISEKTSEEIEEWMKD